MRPKAHRPLSLHVIKVHWHAIRVKLYVPWEAERAGLGALGATGRVIHLRKRCVCSKASIVNVLEFLELAKLRDLIQVKESLCD